MSLVTCHSCHGYVLEADSPCADCDGVGGVDPLRYVMWVGDLLGGERLRQPGNNSCPSDPTVEPSIVAALNHWLDGLPDSPQAATLAGRLAKLKHRLVWGSAQWRQPPFNSSDGGRFLGVTMRFDNGPLTAPDTVWRLNLLLPGGDQVSLLAMSKGPSWFWKAEHSDQVLRAGTALDCWEAMRKAEESVGVPAFPVDQAVRFGYDRDHRRVVCILYPEGE